MSGRALVAPLWPDSVSVAALQARLGIEAGECYCARKPMRHCKLWP